MNTFLQVIFLLIIKKIQTKKEKSEESMEINLEDIFGDDSIQKNTQQIKQNKQKNQDIELNKSDYPDYVQKVIIYTFNDTRLENKYITRKQLHYDGEEIIQYMIMQPDDNYKQELDQLNKQQNLVSNFVMIYDQQHYQGNFHKQKNIYKIKKKKNDNTLIDYKKQICKKINYEQFLEYENKIMNLNLISKGSSGYILPAIKKIDGSFVKIQDQVIKYIKGSKKNYNSVIREINILKYLNDQDSSMRNVPKFYGCYQYIDDKKFNILIYQEKLEITLQDLTIKTRFEKLSESEKIYLFQQIAFKVQFIHNNRLAHCDINTGNFMLQKGQYYRIKLIDFGAASQKNFCNENKMFSSPPELDLLAKIKQQKNNDSEINFLKTTIIKLMMQDDNKKNNLNEIFKYDKDEQSDEENNNEQEYQEDIVDQKLQRQQIEKIYKEFYEIEQKNFKEKYNNLDIREYQKQNLGPYELEQLQSKDIFGLGLLYLELLDQYNFIQRIQPKPADNYDQLIAIVKTIIYVKIKNIQQINNQNYKYLNKFYTLLGNIIIGLIEFKKEDRTSLDQLQKQFQILGRLSSYIETTPQNQKNFFELLMIKNKTENKFNCIIKEDHIKPTHFYHKMVKQFKTKYQQLFILQQLILKKNNFKRKKKFQIFLLQKNNKNIYHMKQVYNNIKNYGNKLIIKWKNQQKLKLQKIYKMFLYSRIK